jgi:hypothetical protein
VALREYRAVFTINTEAGEIACVLHLHQLLTTTNSSEEEDGGGETPRVGAVGGVGRSEKKAPPSGLNSIIRVEISEEEEQERHQMRARKTSKHGK